MIAASGYKTKKDLKASVGKPLRFQETSIFGSEYDPNGKNVVVGPSATDRRWYATVTCADDKIVRVS